MTRLKMVRLGILALEDNLKWLANVKLPVPTYFPEIKQIYRLTYDINVLTVVVWNNRRLLHQ